MAWSDRHPGRRGDHRRGPEQSWDSGRQEPGHGRGRAQTPPVLEVRPQRWRGHGAQLWAQAPSSSTQNGERRRVTGRLHVGQSGAPVSSRQAGSSLDVRSAHSAVTGAGTGKGHRGLLAPLSLLHNRGGGRRCAPCESHSAVSHRRHVALREARTRSGSRCRSHDVVRAGPAPWGPVWCWARTSSVPWGWGGCAACAPPLSAVTGSPATGTEPHTPR